MLILALIAAFSIPDLSGVRLFLSDLEPGIPLPALMFNAPFPWAPPVSDGLFFRAGFEAGRPRSFHCRSNGVTAGRSFFTGAWFSPDGWAYSAESHDLLRFTATGGDNGSTDFMLLETADGRLGMGFLADTEGTAPIALWETRMFTAAAGTLGSGIGFAVEAAPWLSLGPAVTGEGPWIKSSLRLGRLEVQSGPGVGRSGDVRGVARASFRGRNWLLAAFHDGDSLFFGATAAPCHGVLIGITGPEPGCLTTVEFGGLTLSGSTFKAEEWCAGASFAIPFGTLSAWGVLEDQWEAGIGLELGKGVDLQPGLPLHR